MKKLTIAAAMLTVACPGIAMAQQGPADPWGDKTITRAEEETGAGERFDKADANKDGSLSPEELQASRPAGPGGPGGPGGGRERGGPGGMMDADGDGKITKQEYVAAQTRRFDMLDANKDGQVTKAERDALRARMQRPSGGGNWGGGGGGGWGGSSDDD